MTGQLVTRFGDHHFKVFFSQSTKYGLQKKINLFCNPLYQPLCLLILETGSIQYLGWPIHFITSSQNVTRAGVRLLIHEKSKLETELSQFCHYNMHWNLFFIHGQIEVKFRLRHNFTLGRTLKWPNAFYKLSLKKKKKNMLKKINRWKLFCN